MLASCRISRIASHFVSSPQNEATASVSISPTPPAERARPAAADEVVDSWTPPWAGMELMRGRRGRGRWSPWWGSWLPGGGPFPGSGWGLGKEAAALVAIRAALRDPGQVLRGWDLKSGDPCRWNMVAFYEGHVQELSMAQQNLSGTLSPAIGRLRSLTYLSLRQNDISGPIPETIGRMKLLQVLDLSSNQFSGSIPSALGNLEKLQQLKLNNNSLSGPVPDSLATARMIFTLDVSFNNLSGPRPTFLASNVAFDGNPLLSGINCEGSELAGVGTPLQGGPSCSESLSLPVVAPEDMKKDDSQVTDKKIIIFAIYIGIGCILLVALVAGAVVLINWHWRRRQRQRVFAVADDEDPSYIR